MNCALCADPNILWHHAVPFDLRARGFVDGQEWGLSLGGGETLPVCNSCHGLALGREHETILRNMQDGVDGDLTQTMVSLLRVWVNELTETDWHLAAECPTNNEYPY